jgi:formylmethanofuran dehydrogenase subunit B
MDIQTEDNFHHNIASTFCGLCCDDLTVQLENSQLLVADNGCDLCQAGFTEPLPPAAAINRQPQINGNPCSLDDALARSAHLLRDSHYPLFGGLATDVSGARATLQLADRIGAIIDHMNSAAMMRNTLAVQDSGWMTTTLAEVRNRVDLLVVFGNGIAARTPRFYERFFNNAESMFGQDTQQRELVLIGANNDNELVQNCSRITRLPCAPGQLGDIAMALRALLNGKPLPADNIAGIPQTRLLELVNRLRNARYSVVTWNSAELDFPHAELTVQACCELVKDLNTDTRCSALPLGGSNGDHTFAQVATWQTGFATRFSLASGKPHFDPVLFDGERLLSEQEADLLLWISAFDTNCRPPSSAVPAIVLGRAGMQCETAPEVFIPVATPGIDHSGHIYRCDTVAVLPLQQLRNTELLSVAAVLQAITEHL